MTPRKTAILVAALAAATLAGAMPAEAGRRTGTWRYSPEEIYAQAEAQRRAQWYEYRRHQEWEAHRGWGPRYQSWGPRRGDPFEPRWSGPRDDSYLYGD